MSPSLASLREETSFAAAQPVPDSQKQVSESETLTHLGTIFRMAQESKLEAQLEASKILCDLSMEENMRQSLCDGGCIPVLRNLITSSHSDWTKQHALLALANLSDSTIHQVQRKPCQQLCKHVLLRRP